MRRQLWKHWMRRWHGGTVSPGLGWIHPSAAIRRVKFREVFRRARGRGFSSPVAHAGEEGPPEYVREALDVLEVVRIDHGNNALADADLVAELVRRRIPLTVCPLSNVKLRVVDDITAHPLKRMLDLGLLVTVNSDDPAYFGGYVNENYVAVAEALDLGREELAQLARNSIEASLLGTEAKSTLILELGYRNAQVWVSYSRPAVNTSLYAYHPLSLRMIVLNSSPKPAHRLTEFRKRMVYHCRQHGFTDHTRSEYGAWLARRGHDGRVVFD